MRWQDILLTGGAFVVPYSAGALVMARHEWWIWPLLIVAAVVNGIIIGVTKERAAKQAVAQFKADMGYGARSTMGSGIVGANPYGRGLDD